MPKSIYTYLLALTCCLLLGVAAAQAPLDLQSVTALETGPDGVLFVADTLGSAVYALDVGEQGRTSPSDEPVTLNALDQRIAALLGTTAEEILITDMVVSPASQNIYLAVHRGLGPDAVPVILRVVRGDNTLEIVPLETTSYTSAQIPNPPAAGEALEFGTPLRVLTITDIHYYDGELFVAGVSNEEFASTLRRVPYPFTGDLSVSSVEIYHTVHDQFETRAPIVTQLVQEINGVPYLIAAYTCTPVVRFPLADLTDGAHVVGETLADLGYGNAPIDMVRYLDPYEQKEYLLITNDQRSPVRIDPLELAGAQPLTEAAFHPVGLNQQVLPLTGALHIDLLNDRYSVAVRRNVLTHELNLMTLNTGLFFDRAESIVEYNWPGVHNPFIENLGLVENDNDFSGLTDNKSAR